MSTYPPAADLITAGPRPRHPWQRSFQGWWPGDLTGFSTYERRARV